MSHNDACDVTLSVYPHRASLKNMPDHGGNRTYDLWNTSPHVYTNTEKSWICPIVFRPLNAIGLARFRKQHLNVFLQRIYFIYTKSKIVFGRASVYCSRAKYLKNSKSRLNLTQIWRFSLPLGAVYMIPVCMY